MLSPGDQLSPWPEPQWNAERRAAPSLSLPRERGRVRVGAAPCPQGAGQTTRLSAFRFPFCLRPGWVQGKTREWRGGEALEKMVAGKPAREQKSRRENESACAVTSSRGASAASLDSRPPQDEGLGSKMTKSVRFDAGELDHLGPFLGFAADELLEVGGRAGEHVAAEIGKALSHSGIGERGIDLLVENLDH